jgi:hypothetical protein
MPRVTTQQLKQEIDVIKNNHLAHMAQDIDELKEDIKDNRKFFTERMDRLDNRIWWVLGLTVTTLVSILIGSMV